MESASVGRTFVITSQTRQGLEKLTEFVEWQSNALCAVQYLGTRSDYKKKMDALYEARYSQTGKDAYYAMQSVDVGGDEVYMIVPRFDLETISVFSIAVDSANKAHILRQSCETTEPFLLICDTGDNPNAEVTIALGDSKAQKMRLIMRRNVETGNLSLPSGIQVLS